MENEARRSRSDHREPAARRQGVAGESRQGKLDDDVPRGHVHAQGPHGSRAAERGRLMTPALPFSQASMERRIKAAIRCGLRVTGLGPDGTVFTAESSEDAPVPPLTSTEPKPRDAREKFGA